MNEEILSGLRTGMERGFSLDSAVQSFINAGYNPAEVNEAAALVARGQAPASIKPSSQIPVQPLPKTPQVGMPQPKLSETSKLQTTEKPATPKKMKLLLIIAIILILLIVGGAIAVLLFKDQILGLFGNSSVSNV
jgi:hypothetical protein